MQQAQNFSIRIDYYIISIVTSRVVNATFIVTVINA